MLPYNGRGVRVAVIDSGVNPRHPHISGVAGGIAISAAGEVDAGDFLDRLGHGTAVMAAIQEKAPAADYFAVKVFHDSLRTSSRCLVRALEWALEQNIDVVNLSLGTPNPKHAELFLPLVQRAAQQGVGLVAAREADGVPQFPGCLSGAFGVSLDEVCDRNQYRVEQTRGGAVYFASGFPRSAPGVPRERNLQGISFAVANMTGFIAQAREAAGGHSLETLRAVLAANSCNASEP